MAKQIIEKQNEKKKLFKGDQEVEMSPDAMKQTT